MRMKIEGSLAVRRVLMLALVGFMLMLPAVAIRYSALSW